MAQLIHRIAEVKGSQPALIDERGSTSWSEFDERANRFIDAMRARGLGPGSTIAFKTGNRREPFEITAADAHAAWVIVPVNWHWVEDELVYVVQDAGADALIVEDQFFEVGRAAADQLVGTCPVRIVIGEVEAGAGDQPSRSGPFEAYEAVLASGSPTEPTDQARGGTTRADRG